MINRSTFVRTLLMAIAITILAGAMQSPMVTAQEPAVDFQRLMDQTDDLAPVYGPENADLPFGIFEACPECTWSAGHSLTDVRIHLELIWPADSLSSGTLYIAVRQSDPESLSVVDPNFFVISPASWVAGGAVGSLAATPAVIDIIVTGNTGYLAVDGQFVGTSDLSDVLRSGDVVLTTVAYGFDEPRPLSILDFTVWDLGSAGSASASQSAASSTDAEMFQTHRLAALAQPLLYGPESGALPHDPTSVTIDDPAVSVSDFSARVSCVAPSLPAGGYWDCGFRFRDLSSEAKYTLGIVSDGSWFFEFGSGHVLLEGTLDASIDVQSGRMTLELIAVGSEGYFAVNDTFVSSLDLSTVAGPGTVAVATSFFQETYVEGGSTGFEDFTIVSLDVPVVLGEATAQPSSSGSARSPVMGNNSHTDTTFGYSLTWDDTWTIVDPVPGQSEYLLRLTNGSVTADIHGSAGGADATACVNNLLSFYQNTAGYSNAAFVLDGNGAQVLSPGSDMALGLLTFAFADEKGLQNTVYDYVMCAATSDGQGMVVMEQYVAPEEYTSQVDAMNSLQLGVTFDTVSDTPDATDPASVASVENSYTSPVFGYRLTWDETWTQQSATGDEDYGTLTLTSERATAVLSASETSAQAATECFDALIDSYRSDPDYSNVRFVVDQAGRPILTPGDFVATALLQYGRTDSGSADLGYDYVLCARMPDRGPMVVLEQFIPADEFVRFKPQMEALQTGLWIVEEKSITPPGLTGLDFAILPVSAADQAMFGEILVASDAGAPVVGPAAFDLVMQRAEFATWSAGLSASDIRVHIELAPPVGALDADWELQIAFRAAGYGSDSFYLGSDGVFSSNGVVGYRNSVPGTIDLVADGDIGYLAFDGELIGLIDVSTWMQPGDVVISAVNSAQPAGTSTMHVFNVTIWELGGQP